jgi:hypothetical protein
MRPLATALRGYRAGPPAERAAFGMSIGFSAAIGISRAVNYVRERRRAAPRLRSWGRRVYHGPGRQELRVHHFLPGIGVAFLAGGAAIFTRQELRFSLPFGVGAGLTSDEIALLGQLDNPYWGSETFALVQAGVAAALGAGLGVRFHRRGAALGASPEPGLARLARLRQLSVRGRKDRVLD